MSLLKKSGRDIRLLWDSHRHYGVAQRLGADIEPALQGFRRWYQKHPRGVGFPWGCAMESSFRICNLALLVGEAGATVDLANWLHQEARFIAENLERKAANNHYLLNVIGLLVADRVLDNFSSHVDPVSELQSILETQFLSDGTNFEASTAYHFLTMEAVAVAALTHRDVGAMMERRKHWIRKSLRFMSFVLSDGGHLLQIGDDDGSSCFFPLGTRQLRTFQFELCKMAFGDTANDSKSSDGVFENFGLVCRDANGVRIFFYGTRNGQNGKGGHAHNDKLAVALWLYGYPVLVDSGTGSYSKNRNGFRSSAAHNTISVEGFEPCDLSVGSFRLPDDAKTSIARKSGRLWVGSHSFVRSKMRFERTLELKDRQVCVGDVISNRPSPVDIVSSLVVHPTVLVSLEARVVTLKTPSGDVLCVRSEGPIDIVDHEVSETYGTSKRTRRICLRWPTAASRLSWTLEWL